MSIITPEEPPRVEHDPAELERTLERMERGLEQQERRVRAAINGFSIFALLAVLISLGMLVTVAIKLQAKPDATPAAATPAAAKPAAAKPAAAAPAAAAPKNIGVALREYTVNPTSAQASAGKVTFRVRNAGTITHEFVVLRTAKPAADLLKGNRADEAGNVGETGDLKAGASKTITINLKAGHYALICNLPGHYVAGQHTDFTVR